MSGGAGGSVQLPLKGERNITKAGNIITEYLFDSDRKGRGETNQSGSNRSAWEVWPGGKTLRHRCTTAAQNISIQSIKPKRKMVRNERRTDTPTMPRSQ
jgi:hypothetical protein